MAGRQPRRRRLWISLWGLLGQIGCARAQLLAFRVPAPARPATSFLRSDLPRLRARPRCAARERRAPLVPQSDARSGAREAATTDWAVAQPAGRTCSPAPRESWIGRR